MKDNKKAYIFLAIIVFIFICLNGYLLYRYLTKKSVGRYEIQQSKDISPKTENNSPTPLIPDDGDKGTYIISQPKNQSPVVRQVVFDPLVVNSGQDLSISLTLDSESKADKITGTLQTDNKIMDLTFEKQTDQTPEVWLTKINLDDTINTKYILTIRGIDGNKSAKVVVAPRS